MTTTTERHMTTIEYKDIKAGDQLKVTVEYERGTLVVTEGTAAYKNSFEWVTDDRATLLEMDISGACTRTIELVSRPVMPYETGSLIRAIIKGRPSRYPAVLARVEKAERQDEMVWLELAGTGDTFHTEDDILSWVLLKLEPVG